MSSEKLSDVWWFPVFNRGFSREENSTFALESYLKIGVLWNIWFDMKWLKKESPVNSSLLVSHKNKIDPVLDFQLMMFTGENIEFLLFIN